MMKSIKTWLKARMTYLFLLVLSLPIPILHHRLADDAMNTTRGNWALTPAPFLFVKWFGEFANLIPVVLVLLLFLSVKIDKLIRPTTMCAVAIAFCAFTTFYGWYCCWLLSHVLIER